MNEQQVRELWSKACDHLQKVLHPDIFARWIAVIQPVSVTGTTMTLQVGNNFYQTWLEDNYLPLIRDAVAAAHDAELSIKFTITEPESAAAPLFEAPPVTSRKPRTGRDMSGRARPAIEPNLNKKFTFDEFVVGPSNNFAHAAAMAVAQAPARAYNPLFIYGGTGLGKTHLMQAIGQQLLRQSAAQVVYISSEAFLNEYIEALQNQTIAAFRRKYRSIDLLLIDDVHFLAGKQGLQEEIFHTFNALYGAQKQIVLTSDRPASEIRGLEQRLVSRFECGLVTELLPPELETRIAILRRKKEQARLPLSDEALVFIAESIRSNVRRLEGALIRVTSYASLTGRELTMIELENLLRDTLEQEQQAALTFDTIMRAVAERYDVRLADLTSKRRPRVIAVPRQIAMYLCRSLTSSSLPEIANAFGKTHATVLHAYRTVEKRMAQDSDLAQRVAQIARHLEK